MPKPVIGVMTAYTQKQLKQRNLTSNYVARYSTYFGTFNYWSGLLVELGGGLTLRPAKHEPRCFLPRSRRGFLLENECEGSLLGTAMLTVERCRDRAAECQQMAEHAPSARIRVLLDVARTWTRLALEAEQWAQLNRPSARLTKAAPTNAPREAIKPTQLSPRSWQR